MFRLKFRPAPISSFSPAPVLLAALLLTGCSVVPSSPAEPAGPTMLERLCAQEGCAVSPTCGALDWPARLLWRPSHAGGSPFAAHVQLHRSLQPADSGRWAVVLQAGVSTMSQDLTLKNWHESDGWRAQDVVDGPISLPPTAEVIKLRLEDRISGGSCVWEVQHPTQPHPTITLISP